MLSRYPSDIEARRSLSRWRLFCLLATVSTCCCLGCTEGPSQSSESSDETQSADEILRATIAAYGQAVSYSDRGVVRLRYRLDGRWVHDEGKLAVTFARPNKLSLQAYQLALTSDGNRLHARIVDESTADFDGQIMVRPAPQSLGLDDLYDDPMILNVMAGGMGGPPATLELLLEEEPLKNVFEPGVKRELLGKDDIRQRPCHRVKITLETGALVFWIDCKSHVVRRLEYPTAKLAQEMAKNANCSDVTLTAEFRDARIDRPIDKKSFRFDIPDDAKIVRRFVVPPQSLPTEMLGQTPGDFHFVNLQGEAVTRDSLLGKVAVLVWFNDHPASQMGLEQISTVYAKYADEPRISFHAVCTEPTDIGNQHLKQLQERWKIGYPVVRDLQAFGRDVFAVPFAPTTVVLDPRGAVQVFEVGANPGLARQLPGLLQEVLDGGDPASKIVAKCEEERAEYERELAESMVPDPENAKANGRTLR